MVTLETLIEELKQAPPEHLEAVQALVRTLKAKDEANRQLAAQLHEIFSEPDDLSEEAWDDITAYQQRLRAELFTRLNPFVDDADAARF